VGAGQVEQLSQALLDGVGVQDLDAGVAGVDQGVPQLRERGGDEPFVCG
jgi:hypothetical protein